MNLDHTRLDLATRVTVQALRGQPDLALDARLQAFEAIYDAIADLDAGDDAWTEATLKATLELVENAFPRGGAVDAVVAGVQAIHAAVVATTGRPKPDRRPRPRRDA